MKLNISINLGLSLLFMSVLLCSCIVEDPAPRFARILKEDKLLAVQDSTRLEVDFGNDDGSKHTVLWSTNIGTISGDGNRATYVAPDKKGIALINAVTCDKKNNIRTYTAEVTVFKQLIFLKADDLVFNPSETVSTRWRSFIDYIKSENIKAGIGLIGNSLEAGDSNYYAYIKDLAASGCFEIWNHGYDHVLGSVDAYGVRYSEFKNTSRGEQKAHLLKTQNLAKEKLGITLHAFGAPGNAIDENTLTAVEKIDDLKVWLFGPGDFSKMTILRLAEVEYPLPSPVSSRFQTAYNAHRKYLALQIHPNAWNENQLAEFKNIIDFLVNNEVTFMLPYEYYQLMEKTGFDSADTAPGGPDPFQPLAY